jgi:mannose-6-phosphate isomerase-like protein (cupin superfamily)
MFVRRPRDCPEIVANDGSRLRELLHPDRDGSGISYSLASAEVDVGSATLPHRLQQETEVYCIVRGSGRMHVDDEVREVAEGDVVLIPPGARQWIENTGDRTLRFLCLVDPPWREEHDVLS